MGGLRKRVQDSLMASERLFLICQSNATLARSCGAGGGSSRQRPGLIIRGKRRSCPPQYGHRDPQGVQRRLGESHGSDHGFPLIRSLRGSAQRSTSVLFSFVLSFDCARIIHHRTIKNELRLPLELSKPQQQKVAESESC